MAAPGDGRRFVFDLATGRTQISPASDGRQARPFLRPLSESIGIFVVCRAPFCPAVVRRNRRTTRPFAAAHARGYAKAPTLTAAGHAEPRRRNLARSSAGRTCERHRGDGRGSAALQLDAHPADTASLGQPVGRSIAWKPRQQALVIGGSVRQSPHNVSILLRTTRTRTHWMHHATCCCVCGPTALIGTPRYHPAHCNAFPFRVGHHFYGSSSRRRRRARPRSH